MLGCWGDGWPDSCEHGSPNEKLTGEALQKLHLLNTALESSIEGRNSDWSTLTGDRIRSETNSLVGGDEGVKWRWLTKQFDRVWYAQLDFGFKWPFSWRRIVKCPCQRNYIVYKAALTHTNQWTFCKKNATLYNSRNCEWHEMKNNFWNSVNMNINSDETFNPGIQKPTSKCWGRTENSPSIIKCINSGNTRDKNRVICVTMNECPNLNLLL